MRRIALSLLLFLLLGPLPGGTCAPRPGVTSDRIIATAVPGVAPGRRFGALTLTEAWDLSSGHDNFGGISGMALTAPRRFLLVSDAGDRLQFALDSHGGVSQSAIRAMPPISPEMTSKHFLDAEAVTRDPRTGNFWVALEGVGQIWRFDAAGVRRSRLRNPIMARWPANGGAEALVRLADRRFLVLSERRVKQGHHEGLLFAGDPADPRTAYVRFLYDSKGQGSVSDAAALPDGRLLILHRKLGLWPLFTSTIAIADPRNLRNGARLTSRTIATINSPDLAENYEGIVVEQGGAGLALWMVSDDNQNDWQHSRLLRFTMDPAALQPEKKHSANAATKKAAPSPVRPS